ncbi:MAG: alpha/beta fold hydrolase [Proteobacteria bacterium]|nr:alpha/beta fold hydrolase [Pseudomonadota bacterium]
MDSSIHVASDGTQVHCYRWNTKTDPRALIHIAHGMGEHALRYEWAAQKLNQAGYEVTANDHRGHGRTANTLGDFGVDGWNRSISDLHEILQQLKSNHPGLPLILFGHSMGAMMSQQYIARYGDTIDAVVLSGSPGAGHRFQMWLVHIIARFERWRLGDRAESVLLQNLLFGGNNRDFDEDGASGYEWLSRDEQQVQAYMQDPLCGFVPCPMSLCDLFAAERNSWKAESVAGIPAGLRTYLFSGSADPVHNGMKNINRLLECYADHGMHISTRFYTGGRHEMLNETNRDEVIEDVISWLDSVRLG